MVPRFRKLESLYFFSRSLITKSNIPWTRFTGILTSEGSTSGAHNGEPGVSKWCLEFIKDGRYSATHFNLSLSHFQSLFPSPSRVQTRVRFFCFHSNRAKFSANKRKWRGVMKFFSPRWLSKPSATMVCTSLFASHLSLSFILRISIVLYGIRLTLTVFVLVWIGISTDPISC